MRGFGFDALSGFVLVIYYIGKYVWTDYDSAFRETQYHFRIYILHLKKRFGIVDFFKLLKLCSITFRHHNFS